MSLKLYLITSGLTSYDEYDSAVVAAKSPKDARKIHPNERYLDVEWWETDSQYLMSSWVSPEEVVVEYLGVARSGTKRGVICASFNAG